MPKEIFTGPWYPWYINDILNSERVERMTLLEEGAYRRALDKSWEKGSLPADPVLCAKRIGKKCTPQIAAKVLEMYEPMPKHPDRMINKKQEKVRKESETFSRKKSEAGRKGAAKRWKTKSKPDSTAISEPIAKNGKHNTTQHSTKEEEKELSNESSKKTKSASSAAPSRIPRSFPITPEMFAWLAEEFPEGFDYKTAHENFIEYWTNQSGRDGLKLDWNLTWKKGMRLAKKWQDEDAQNANGKSNGNRKSNTETIRSHDYSEFAGIDPVKEFGPKSR